MEFVVTTALGLVEHHAIDSSDRIVIGRDPGCDLVLCDQDVSRRHLVLERAAGDWQLSDTSRNGTFVGPRLLHGESCAFDGATVLRVGPFTLQLQREAAVAPVEQVDTNRLEVELRAGEVGVDVRRKIHRMLLEHLDLAALEQAKMKDEVLRPRVLEALRTIVDALELELPPACDRERLIREMGDEALGLGPLEELLADSEVSEIMVVDPQTIYCERNGRIELTKLAFTDDDSCRAVIERIVTPLGRRIDESTPYVDARLKDGSRVNAVIPPLALRGPCITIRKFAAKALGVDDLLRFDSLSPQMARFLTRAVSAKKNVVISGGTGSGKTTLLNILSAAIPSRERIVTIEDAAELRLEQPHVVSLETRPANMEGRGAVSIRDLLRNALRMRPDRIVVGECRGGEALDMLQAMNTGHDGSMTTTHANSPAEALSRLETLCLMAGLDLPARAIREQIATSIEIVVQQTRLADGTRRVTCISEIVGIDSHGDVEVRDIFEYLRTGTAANGTVEGAYRATGYLPTFLADFVTCGLVDDGEYL